jgi:sensor histidine kinase regulating citrate/malate metabolism
MLAIVFIKMLQVVVFYVLAKKHVKFQNSQKRPAIVLGGLAIVDFVFLFMIRMYVESPDLSPKQNHLLVWLAIGALVVMVAIFIIYELFIREEIKNVELAMKLQRLELESSFFKEIDNIYSDMRTWQHEYKNNLSSLRALVDNGEKEKALDFISNMHGEVYKKQIVLQTGNLVLDSIVSSKLWLAQSKNIEVNIQAAYPENNRISDNDLCAIAGNLIDNAIEACVRMEESTEKKFIDFLLMIKGKNLLLSIRNSYNNELKRKGKRYLTVKREPFHGIGILHVDSIVDKYQGHVLRSQENGVFETNIMLPLLPLNESDND